jgi:hypothetical protein
MENAGLGHGKLLVLMLSRAKITPCTRIHMMWPAGTQLQIHPYVKLYLLRAHSLSNSTSSTISFKQVQVS